MGTWSPLAHHVFTLSLSEGIFQRQGPVLSNQHVISLRLHKGFLTSIIKTTSQPIMPRLCSAVSPDFPHFLLQTASGGTQRCLPSGPASFRATYLPMSGGLIFRWRHDQFILCTLQSASAPSLPAVWFPAAGHLFSSLKATLPLFVAQTGSPSDPSGAFSFSPAEQIKPNYFHHRLGFQLFVWTVLRMKRR